MTRIKTIKKYLNSLVHLVYPSICVICARSLSNQEKVLCIPCSLSLPLTNFHQLEKNPLEKKFWGREEVASVQSLLFMEKLSKTEKLIYSLKYQGREDVGEYLAERTILILQKLWLHKGIQAIVCVPLHTKRQKQRGYNQCHRFCQTLSKALEIPFYPQALTRISYHSSQTQMNRSSRWENVSQAFELTNKKVLEGKDILLIDDVLTTGATLEACVSTIKKNASARVHLFTFACKI